MKTALRAVSFKRGKGGKLAKPSVSSIFSEMMLKEKGHT